MKNRFVIVISSILVLFIIFLCFYAFQAQTRSYIDNQIREQLITAQDDSITIVQNEINYLISINRSFVDMLERVEINSDEEFIEILENAVTTSGVVRILFVTLDGKAYTSYAGYLGQSEENTTFNGIPLSEYDHMILSDPFYSDEVGRIIFGVITPCNIAGMDGLFVTSYNMENIISLLNEKFPQAEISTFITNSDGIRFNNPLFFGSSYFDSLENAKFLSSSLSSMKEDFSSFNSGSAEYILNDLHLHVTYRPLGVNDWYIIQTIQDSFLNARYEAIQSYGIQLTVELVIAMALMIVVVILVRVHYDRRIREILKKEAMFDGVTHIYNRKTTEEMIEKALSSSESDLKPVVLILDVDNFKRINDTMGHLWGDLVLKECANRLLKNFSDEGIVGRLGGDEFMVYIPSTLDSTLFAKKLSELRGLINVYSDDGSSIAITLSIGMAWVNEIGTDFYSLYQAADSAMYKEKERKKNSRPIFS